MEGGFGEGGRGLWWPPHQARRLHEGRGDQAPTPTPPPQGAHPKGPALPGWSWRSSRGRKGPQWWLGSLPPTSQSPAATQRKGTWSEDETPSSADPLPANSLFVPRPYPEARPQRWWLSRALALTQLPARWVTAGQEVSSPLQEASLWGLWDPPILLGPSSGWRRQGRRAAVHPQKSIHPHWVFSVSYLRSAPRWA